MRLQRGVLYAVSLLAAGIVGVVLATGAIAGASAHARSMAVPTYVVTGTPSTGLLSSTERSLFSSAGVSFERNISRIPQDGARIVVVFVGCPVATPSTQAELGPLVAAEDGVVALHCASLSALQDAIGVGVITSWPQKGPNEAARVAAVTRAGNQMVGRPGGWVDLAFGPHGHGYGDGFGVPMLVQFINSGHMWGTVNGRSQAPQARGSGT